MIPLSAIQNGHFFDVTVFTTNLVKSYWLKLCLRVKMLLDPKHIPISTTIGLDLRSSRALVLGGTGHRAGEPGIHVLAEHKDGNFYFKNLSIHKGLS